MSQATPYIRTDNTDVILRLEARVKELETWQGIESAPNRGYHLLCIPTKPHLSGIFLGQVVDGRPWNPGKGWVDEATLWMPIVAPPAHTNKEQS